MTYTEELRQYFQKASKVGKTLSDNEPLLEGGLLDSLEMVGLLAFIEREFEVVVHDADFDPENFATIAAIGEMIDRLKK